MKKVLISLILFILFFVLGCNVNKEDVTSIDKHEAPDIADMEIDNVSEDELKKEEGAGSTEQKCAEAGGTWRQMSNACVDSCESQRDDMMCAQVLTYGCDCGEGKCWNGNGCENI